MDTFAFDPVKDNADSPVNTGPSSKPFYCTGVSYFRSTVTIRQVKDGLSYTYLVGEKFLFRDLYGSGLDGSDNEFLFTGWDNDLYRSGGWDYKNNGIPNEAASPAPATPPDYAPLQDTKSLGNASNTVPHYDNRWGSAHNSTLNMVYCDGSVHQIPYTIDLVVHRRLHNRADGVKLSNVP
jgi:prepilin-type processing-associated H-X9-DG protein